MKRQRFYCLVSFAQTTDIHLNGKTVKLHDWPKMGRQLLVQWTMDNVVLLVVPGLSSSSSSSLSSTSRSTDQFNCFRKLGTLSDPVTTRSGKRTCGKPMQTDPEKLASGNHGPARQKDEMNKEDPTQGISKWLQPFTDILEDLETNQDFLSEKL